MIVSPLLKSMVCVSICSDIILYSTIRFYCFSYIVPISFLLYLFLFYSFQCEVNRMFPISTFRFIFTLVLIYTCFLNKFMDIIHLWIQYNFSFVKHVKD